MCVNGANKTCIIYNCNLNFYTVVPYLDLLIKNRLVAKIDGAIVRYQITPKGTNALWHFGESEELIAEFRGAVEEMKAEE